MTTDDDMRARILNLETKFEGLATQIAQLPIKADFEGMTNQISTLVGEATKADFERMTNKVSILVGEAKEDARKAAEGYKATLDRIERKLGELNKNVDVRLSDHDKVLANHNERLDALEPPERG